MKQCCMLGLTLLIMFMSVADMLALWLPCSSEAGGSGLYLHLSGSLLLYTWVWRSALCVRVWSQHELLLHTQSLFERVNNECVRPSSCWFINSSFLFTCSPAKRFARLHSWRSLPPCLPGGALSCGSTRLLQLIVVMTVIESSLRRLKLDL